MAFVLGKEINEDVRTKSRQRIHVEPVKWKGHSNGRRDKVVRVFKTVFIC